MTNSKVTTSLTHLKQLAEAATPGPWWVEHYAERDSAIVCGTPGDPSDTFDLMERYNVETDYKFIAAFNPATVLKLLASLREMEEALEFELSEYGDDDRIAEVLTSHRERWKG